MQEQIVVSMFHERPQEVLRCVQVEQLQRHHGVPTRKQTLRYQKQKVQMEQLAPRAAVFHVLLQEIVVHRIASQAAEEPLQLQSLQMQLHCP